MNEGPDEPPHEDHLRVWGSDGSRPVDTRSRMDEVDAGTAYVSRIEVPALAAGKYDVSVTFPDGAGAGTQSSSVEPASGASTLADVRPSAGAAEKDSAARAGHRRGVRAVSSSGDEAHPVLHRAGPAKAALSRARVDRVRAARPRAEVRSTRRPVRYWGYIPALERWLRVVTLADGETVHNAVPDRDFEGPPP
jgi:hypothetical protein